MASRYTLKTKDTAPPFTATLEDVNGAIDLTNAEKLELWLRIEGSEGAALQLKMDIGNAKKGEVIVKWAEMNTAADGTYQAEAKIYWKDGTKESVPNDSYEILIITRSL
jgi:hypothetical protein